MSALDEYWRATAEADWHQRERMRASWRRAEAVEEMVSATGLGTTAKVIGLAKGRVQQLVARVREAAQ